MKEKLEIRKNLKRKKPTFSKQDAHKKLKLSSKWRKPRGLQSKMRLKKRGYRRSISVGWKSPADVKGLMPNGLVKKTVNNVSQLAGVDAKTDIVEIASPVGLRTRLMIIEEALKKNIQILNVKDPKKFLEDAQKEIKARKDLKEKKKKDRDTKKEKKAAEKKKKDEEEKKKDEGQTEEEKKEDEKKEKDKILTQKS
jgi:large subunit ribosomal protein L32e